MAHYSPRNGSLMHALIENNVITAIRDAPSGGAWEDGEWLDFTDPTVLSEWEARHGWTPDVDPAPVDRRGGGGPITPAPSGTILDGGTL